jgi:NADPH:quinone reductase-like Zn-dependent oxidoreductase
VLGNEGVGVIEDAADSGLAVGTRVMFTGPYGVGEPGAWQEWLLVRPEHLVSVPDAIDDVVAATVPVAYLTAQITLSQAGFNPGMRVLAPGIGGSVGNATYQLARAQGAARVISTAGSAAKAAKARELGFNDVIDLTAEGLAEGVRRMTAGKGVDIVIESIGGTVTGEALGCLGLGGVLITLGYSAGRKTTVDVTDLIWKRTRMAGFSLFAQSPSAIAAAWRDILPLIAGGAVTPIVGQVYPFQKAGEALRHLIEDRPFGKVALAIEEK